MTTGPRQSVSVYAVLEALRVELAKIDKERRKYLHAIAMVEDLIDTTAPKRCPGCGRDVSRNKIKKCLDCRRRERVARWDQMLTGRLSRRAMNLAARRTPPASDPSNPEEPRE